jgi:hypothetical protein
LRYIAILSIPNVNHEAKNVTDDISTGVDRDRNERKS